MSSLPEQYKNPPRHSAGHTSPPARSALSPRPLSSLRIMAQWIDNATFINEERTLRVSLVTPMEAPNCRYLDIRRVFIMNGVTRPTKLGVRAPSSLETLKAIEGAMVNLITLKTLDEEVGGLSLRRRGRCLHIRRLTSSDATLPSPRLMLARGEALWLKETLGPLTGIMEELPDLEEEEDDSQPQDVWE